MKAGTRLFLLFVGIGLALWVADATIDAYVFGLGSFPDLLILSVPPHELYVRSLILLPLLVLGGALARHVARRRKAEAVLHERERALQASESLHAEAQRVAHVGHWELVPEEGTPTWSAEIFRIFGLDPEGTEPTFEEHERYIHPEDWPALNEAVGRASRDGTPFDIEFRLFRPDGDMRWMHAIGTTETRPDGTVVRAFGTAQDVTERRAAEEAGPLALTEEVRVVLYRSARELLHNVVRHAAATRATLAVRRADDHVRIVVEDDGMGFDPEAARERGGPGGGFGLFDIRERIDYLGGSVDIQSIPEQGTRVTLTAPLEPQG
ncbi:MAG: PAS domain-containing protein [Phycisphaerae bacterium]